PERLGIGGTLSRRGHGALLIALLLLSPVVFRLTREYFAKARS
ncbi:hypothetical protein, partial [Pseudomonas aeruginosa]